MSSATPAPTSYPEGPRHATVTPDDHGALLQIAAWFLMVVMILAVFLRLFIRFTTAHMPGTDDALLFVAMLFGVGEVMAISLGVNHGLGRRSSLLNAAQMTALQKDVYTSAILYLIALALAKASILLLIARLAMVRLHQIIVRALGALILIWTIASVFAVAFQCHAPTQWAYLDGKCYSTIVLWDVVASVDIVTDAALIALPLLIVWDLQMSWHNKLVVASAFSFRSVVIAAQIARLVLLRQLQSSPDPTYDSLAYNIATQCQTALTVIVASIPALKPFMDRAASGMMAISLGQREGTYGVSNNYAMHSLSHRQGSQPKSGKQDSATAAPPFPMQFLRPDRSDTQAIISTSKQRKSPGVSQQIQKTVDWDIQYSDEARLNPESHSVEYTNENASADTGHTHEAI